MISLNRLGDALAFDHQPDEALVQFTEAHELTRRLIAQDPADAEAQRDLVISHYNLGRLHFYMGGQAPTTQTALAELRLARHAFDSAARLAAALRDAGRLFASDAAMPAELDKLVGVADGAIDKATASTQPATVPPATMPAEQR
jgi:hypothetical protein